MISSYEELNAAQAVSETDPFTTDRYRQFFRYLPSSTVPIKVLDIGCNTGRGGQVLKELSSQICLIGLDCVKSRLERLSREVYSQTICSYSTNIALKDAEISAVVAGEFIEHLYEKDVEQTLREFWRVLQPQGRLLLTTPNPSYIRLKLSGGSVLGGAHVSQHYPKTLKQMLLNIGFVNIRIFGSGKMSRILGENFPVLALYGSYLVIADK